MPGFLEIAVAVTAITSAFLGGIFAVWRKIESNINTVRQEAKTEVGRLDQKLDDLEKNTVSKEDYNTGTANTNRALDSITLAMRETGATLTNRIDLVLFEVGRRNNGKPQ